MFTGAISKHFMKKPLIFIVLLIIIFSCSTVRKKTEERCKSILVDNFHRVVIENFFFGVNEGDTIQLKEARYECIQSLTQSTKVMYDNFGIWDTVLYPKDETRPLFLWETVELFPKDTSEFNVFTEGTEDYQTIYTSVMVTNTKDQDLLSDSSSYKEKPIKYFGDLIKSNDSGKRDFYEKYWMTVNPAHWERIKVNFKELE